MSAAKLMDLGRYPHVLRNRRYINRHQCARQLDIRTIPIQRVVLASHIVRPTQALPHINQLALYSLRFPPHLQTLFRFRSQLSLLVLFRYILEGDRIRQTRERRAVHILPPYTCAICGESAPVCAYGTFDSGDNNDASRLCFGFRCLFEALDVLPDDVTADHVEVEVVVVIACGVLAGRREQLPEEVNSKCRNRETGKRKQRHTEWLLYLFSCGDEPEVHERPDGKLHQKNKAISITVEFSDYNEKARQERKT
ncbi:hypothetical protein DFH09DRAFT_1094610 [Mycena vulgaris]|nr:hypothetical protein DFH09DRAFT_1094610 [Mycena vulgaris]